eukprot:CAMPEP_0195089122 /NCGR_PEP_ID=MMETSP0448-20130528/28495_1 /TAXON_ID=66468 /ORGANISM="Heterocapsa triquestra, Strain CCMP 448" /LENGTH=52 /DNA_ID=CAMNT_0040122827 /DNA_START=52 /DNA_END=206 /DNA_ORIENTATION=-
MPPAAACTHRQVGPWHTHGPVSAAWTEFHVSPSLIPPVLKGDAAVDGRNSAT